MAASANTNAILEHVEEGKSYELEFGDTWHSANDGHASKYAFHTIKCNDDLRTNFVSGTFLTFR